jgi:hypothetical protein
VADDVLEEFAVGNVNIIVSTISTEVSLKKDSKGEVDAELFQMR